MRETQAQIIALKGLEHLASTPDVFEKFLSITGINPADISQVVSEKGTLIGILDFLLSDETLLENFCIETGIAPEAPRKARMILSGEDFY